MDKQRLIPLIVATALFMENMDSTVIATSLPAIAADIGTSPLTLKLAITSYLLSLAVFIPASGWTADRFGARMVFSVAIAVFMVGSIGCALSQNVTHFVIARILQGMGGAMMTPVGRLVLLRSIDKSALVNAMTWVTVPALVGPVIGPPLGGFITTYFSWHWIFLINIPVGLLGIFMAMKYIDPIKSEDPERFDLYGLVLAGIGLAGIAFGLSVAGLNLLPWPIIAGLVAVGSISMTLYVMHARRTGSPVLDFSLLRFSTMRASIFGGFLFRLGIGALPFLLPLLMQEGFGLSPFQSGLVTFASAVGAMGMKTLAARIIRAFGFRYMMTVNTCLRLRSSWSRSSRPRRPGSSGRCLTMPVTKFRDARRWRFPAARAPRRRPRKRRAKPQRMRGISGWAELLTRLSIGRIAIDYRASDPPF
jgi:EmrB/QacA subfamily drug resistance transporter